MSDCEDLFLEYWISPAKRKKKNLKENKMCVKHKNNITMKTDEKTQKKKKKKKKRNSKFKEAMEGKKEKKKEKKKNKSLLEINDSFISTHAYSFTSDPVTKPKASGPSSSDHLTQDSKKKTKRKKKVAFDLSPGYMSVKRPEFAFLSPKVNNVSEKEHLKDISCFQFTKTQPIQAQPRDNDSQCTSDDINSQDLFITQKTFRTFSSEPSSGEVSEKAGDDQPQQTITQQDVVQVSPVVKKEYGVGSDTHLQDVQLHQHLKKSSAVSVKCTAMNPYLNDPVVVKPPINITKSSNSRQVSSICLPNTNKPSLPLQTSTASISTQTENFFTTELSSYLSFCRKSGASHSLGNLKALDLSFSQRARKDLEREKNEVKVENEKPSEQQTLALTEDTKGTDYKDPSLHPSSFPEKKDEGLKMKEPAVRQLWSVSTQYKGQTSPSPRSESEAKSADATSSEDNEPVCRPGRLDLTQVRAVQMRLNESFFFKTKGDGQSPRPESPLMKLVQSGGTKNRKCH